MKGHDIGKGVTILRKFNQECNESFEDLHVYYAPSECYKDVDKAQKRRFRTVHKHIKGVTGLKYKVFLSEVARRTSYKWSYFYL